MNAKNGNIESYQNLSCSLNEPGIAYKHFSSSQNFITDLFNGQYRLRENRNGVNFKTLNATGFFDEIQVINNATDFNDNDNNWTTQETGSFDVATDAHWGMEKTYDYWLTKHNRNSVNNAGLAINSYVNFDEYTDNAYWSYAYNCIFYTAGLNYFSSLTCLDVVAHEYGHGVCSYTSNLALTTGSESQALNEGFSDIWGACVEAYAAPNKQKWLIAEDATIVSPFYLRSMSNPPSGLFNPSSDTYGDANWNSQPDGHYRCGVLDKWFYLLSEGGNGTNGIGNTYNVFGITLAKSERIAYRTEQLLQSNANYAMARILSIQAVIELFGNNSCELKAVTDAWYAVGVGAAYAGTIPFTSPFSISGKYENNGNNGSVIYSVDPNFALAYKWTVNGTIQSSNSNPCIFTTPAYNCLGTPYVDLIEYPLKVSFCGQEYNCRPIVEVCGSFNNIMVNEKQCSYNTPSNNPEFLTAKSSVEIIKISPNPNIGDFFIEISDTKKTTSIKEIRVKNRIGQLVFAQKFKENSKRQKVFILNKESNIYFVDIFNGEVWTRQIVLIK